MNAAPDSAPRRARRSRAARAPHNLLKDRDAYIEYLSSFIADAPSSYHAVAALTSALETAGVQRHDEGSDWAALEPGGSGFVCRDGALIAWKAGAAIGPTSPVRIMGSHTDSPGFVVKPQADFVAQGWNQVGVEIYGGPLMTSWLDRDLEFAGRIVTTSGDEHLVRTGAIARIPQLAIHLDREANTGLALDRQRQTQPVIGIDGPDAPTLLGLLAAAAEVEPTEIAGTDLRTHDTQAPARIGATGELYASPRLDNLSSVVASLVALLASEPAEGTISMLAAFDHEELGSKSRSGASGPFLEDVLARLRAGLGASVDEAAQAMAGSWCISADAGHSVHPNYAEKHDPQVRPLAGKGPMLKVNANQRYATDAHGAALWWRACEAAGVATQRFVANNTVPCGSTIGPLTATRLGIRTVDAGVPLLSMHSARELAHVDDLHGLARVMAAYVSGA